MNVRLKLNIVILALFILPAASFTAFSLAQGFNGWASLVQLLSAVVMIIGFIIVKREVNSAKPAPAVQVKEETAVSNNEPVFEELRSPIAEWNATLDDFHHRLETLSGVAEDILKGAQIQSSNVVKSTDAMTEMSSGIQQIAANAEIVSSTSKNASDAAEDGFHLIGKILGQMETIHQTVEQLSEVITDMASHSNEINQIVNTIEDIAGQTHLLALNAAIEAARAGEHGKGFAVVAGEVGKLSKQSTEATSQISEIVSSIQQNVGKAVGMATNGKNEVSNGMTVVDAANRTLKSLKRKSAGRPSKLWRCPLLFSSYQPVPKKSKITAFTMKVQQGGTAKITQLTESLQDFQSAFETAAGKYQDLQTNIETKIKR
ncbi:methyl-accepting chemotaxis protein [Terrilactibacillus sp. S3-3]|nr:methyl-accepting chemotaxis protein [Terrilactibacillus sp. S3-3]